LKILLDHNLDRRLKQHLTDYETATTQEKGWADVLNGELLSLAEQYGFDVLLTADSNIKNQQNISGHRIAILVLRAFNNRLSTHAEMVGQIEAAVANIQPGEILEIFHKNMEEGS
jgi:predicted nuclease of predicted toxin-antitoxin system